MRRKLISILVLFIWTLLYVQSASAFHSQYKERTFMVDVTTFNETSAAHMVLKDNPDFPEPGKVKKIKTRTGGPYPGTFVIGELRTKVEKSSGNEAYIVTLTKSWKATINGIEAKSVWKYKVSPDGVELIFKVENDVLIYSIG